MMMTQIMHEHSVKGKTAIKYMKRSCQHQGKCSDDGLMPTETGEENNNKMKSLPL